MLPVRFEDEGTVMIGKEIWIHRNRQDDKIGEVCQYPLILAYAITCHKARGLTLLGVVVHCSIEFVSGLIYVAVSSVTTAHHL